MNKCLRVVGYRPVLWSSVLLASALWMGSATADPLPVGVPDEGIWSELDAEVSVGLPRWLETDAAVLALDLERGLATLYVDGIPLKTYPITGTSAGSLADLGLREADATELSALDGLTLEEDSDLVYGDTDDDGIPDPVDVLIGAHKTALNGAEYGEGYAKIDYPMGDVDREGGVCTDVIVRAMRNAGVDLQEEIYRDMKDNPKRYRLKKDKKPDRNIEHRRVRRMLPYFKAHYEKLPPDWDPDLTGEDAWAPGDIVFMDTFPNKSGPDHIGIVSEELDENGMPLIINNWTYGFSTQSMALLDFVPVTHRFRPGLTR